VLKQQGGQNLRVGRVNPGGGKFPNIQHRGTGTDSTFVQAECDTAESWTIDG